MVARVASTSLVSNSPLRCSAHTCSSRSGGTVSVIVTSFPPLAEKRTGDHHAVHFGRALADAAHSGLAVPALEGELLADAVAAVDLHRGVDHAAEHLARIELGDGGLDPGILAAVSLPRAVPGEPARRAQLDLGVGQHPLDRLALGEQRPERGALLGV